MLLTIRYSDGRSEPGILLRAGAGGLRVATFGAADVFSLVWREGQWFDDANDAVEIEFEAEAAEGPGNLLAEGFCLSFDAGAGIAFSPRAGYAPFTSAAAN